MAIDTLSVANDVNLNMNQKLSDKADIKDQAGEIKAVQALMPATLEQYNAKIAGGGSKSKDYFATTISPKIKQIKKANSDNKKKIAAKKKAEKKTSSSSSSGGSSGSSSSSSGGSSSSGSSGGSSSSSDSGGGSSSSSGGSSSGGSSSGGGSSSNKKDKKPTASAICKEFVTSATQDWQKRACREGATKALSSKDYGGDAGKACNKSKRTQDVYRYCTFGYAAGYKKLTGKTPTDSGYKSTNTASGGNQTSSFKKTCQAKQKANYPGLSSREAKLVQDACVMGLKKKQSGANRAEVAKYCQTGGGKWDKRAVKRIDACKNVFDS